MAATPELWVTKYVNLVLGKPAAILLAELGFRPNPRAPIPNHIAMELFIFLLAAIFFFWLRSRLSVERPGPIQQFMELLLTNPYRLGVRDMLDDFLGHGGEKYIAMLGSIGIFILFSNLISLIPTLDSPTAQYTVPVGCSVLVFLYYNFCGFRRHGPGTYGKHFLGPLPLMMHALGELEGWVKWVAAPIVGVVGLLMPFVELFSHLARMLSLSARLWANMLASETIYTLILGLTVALTAYLGHLNPAGYVSGVLPFTLPIVFMALHIFVAFVQAFVFTILPVIYVSGAVAEQH
jgi:F-type H+-transporting ATPase subunit a